MKGSAQSLAPGITLSNPGHSVDRDIQPRIAVVTAATLPCTAAQEHRRWHVPPPASVFPLCSSFGGARGSTGRESEIFLNLSAPLESSLEHQLDVVLNHTTLEHIFDVRAASSNLCALSRDVVIVIVPFAQAEHDSPSWGAYWRFKPRCLRELFRENGLEVVYESGSPYGNAGSYLLAAGGRVPYLWRERLPDSQPLDGLGVRTAARSIGLHLHSLFRPRANEAGVLTQRDSADQRI